MGYLRRRRSSLLAVAAAVALLFLASSLGSLFAGTTQKSQESDDGPGQDHRRRLVGPGSSPPTCRARCGGCSPCRPVRVAVHPGRSVPLEYYPEAWRCKCGNKFFMP